MRKNLVSFLGNFFAVGLAWHGIHGNHYAWNVYVFLAWMSTVAWLLVLICRCIGAEKLPARGKVQDNISCLTDLTLAVMLSAFGHFGYAAMQVLQQGIEQNVYTKTQNGGN